MEHLPTTELVIRDGQPIWLMQGNGVVVEHHDGPTAERLFRQECRRRGVRLASGGEQPRRGPSDVDEPGV